MDNSVDDAREAVRRLSAATGAEHTLGGRLAGGETGAYEIRGPAGEALVMKWEADPEGQVERQRGLALSERLRLDAAWPVPEQRAVAADGWLVVLQDLRPGTPVERLTQTMVDELLEMHERRLGLWRPEDEPTGWPDHLIETLIVGGRGYCIHESLRTFDRRTQALIREIEELGAHLRPADLPGRDLVHWDLHPGNILAVGDHVTAVIDTDFVTWGDAAFDLVTLAMGSRVVECDPGVRERLDEAAFGPLSSMQQAAYVGHLLVRSLDWAIRRDRPVEVEQWLAWADELRGVEPRSPG